MTDLATHAPTGDLVVNLPTVAVTQPAQGVTVPDLVTLSGYALGIWWAFGGPTWAGIASIAADEIDGRLARATNSATAHGSSLDWGGDVALTPLALMRLGKETGHETAALAAAPPVLLAQAIMRSNDTRPPIGSARAAIMLAAIVAHEVKDRTRQPNPRRRR